MNKPTAILTADWHIRSDRPVCRTDDYIEAQEKKIKFIFELSNRHGKLPILIAGDIGHKPVWGDSLIKRTLHLFNKSIYDRGDVFIVAGQHDLLNHNLNNLYEKALGILHQEEILTILTQQRSSPENCTKLLWWDGVPNTHCQNQVFVFGFPYGTLITKNTLPTLTWVRSSDKKIALTHQMVIKSQRNKLWPNQKADDGVKLLKKYPCFDLIVTGDNHQTFTVEHEGRLLINPGSLMRMTANQIDHKPSVFLWYEKKNEVEQIFLPIEKNVVDRSHIEINEQRDKRIEAYVTRLKDVEEISFSYEDNLEKFLKLNRTRKRTVEKIWESLSEEI
ncbi:MAG: hypothetical protein GY821_12555 [Gammaproteobacteria bacterium]|nr:hypothetical protein [Gammaproteobacteria bacterium]